MNRKHFIQQCMASAFPRLLDKSLKYERAVRGAERLWERLSADGLGAEDKRPITERNGVYETMPEDARSKFDRFWAAYGLKKGRDAAARAWLQIPNMTPVLAERIVSAAEQACREVGQSHDTPRKYPQGWLTERRWEDCDHTPEKRRDNADRMRLNGLIAEISSLQSINQNGALDDQIAKLRAKIAEIRKSIV